ncbi:hydrogenase nickel incorporation protein HypB [Thermosulfuriphilus sp.]
MCEHCGCQSRHLHLEKAILSANETLAQKNREHFRHLRATVINLISAPGSGKTSLLEATVETLAREIPLAVIEGDPETQRDAERLRQKGIPVVGVTTGGACHLDASMVHQALHQLESHRPRLIFIENVGNLVCPAAFDLGEDLRVVLVSVPEGPDKPEKYPAAFVKADVFCITKADLLAHFDFDPEEVIKTARRIQPGLKTFVLSVKNGRGLREWFGFLKELVLEKGP